MSIKNRIKKIESLTDAANSEFCACRSYQGKVYPRCEVIYETNGVQRIENPVPVFCETCGKPVEKEQIIIEFVESKIKPPDTISR